MATFWRHVYGNYFPREVGDEVLCVVDAIDAALFGEPETRRDGDTDVDR